MGKRGPKPTVKVRIKWSADFAYAIGLITTDGNLSPDGRHINFTTKDFEQANNFQKSLGISYKLGRKSRGGGGPKRYYVVQFSDRFFYKFLNSIGLYKAKSRFISKILIPKKYFFDFLRGCFDGDGTTYSYWDKRWKSSFMYYTSFTSGSKEFLLWIRRKIFKEINCKGHLSIHKKKEGKNPYYQLRYAKKESLILLSSLYHHQSVICLSRKKLKIDKMLGIVKQTLNNN